MARIVSLGASLQDIFLIDHDDLVPTTLGAEAIFGKLLVGGKADIDRIKYTIGGGGVNSAVSFSRFGHETFLMSNVSHDPAGEAILKTLRKEKINQSFVDFFERKSTGLSVILLDKKSGERTILTHRGASEEFENLDVKDLDLIQPDWLYITTLRGDFKTLASFVKKAKAIGVKVMFNPGVKELENVSELKKILRSIDILIVNKSEAKKIAGGEDLAEILCGLAKYVRAAIITDGANGGIAGNADGCYKFGIYEDVKIKDTTGAGDAFGAGFLAAFAAGKSFKKSLEYASANSTAVVQKIGGNAGALRKDAKLHPMVIRKM